MEALNSALKAVDAELSALSTSRFTRRCKVDYYEWLKTIGASHVYRIWVSDDLKLREDAEITLSAPQQKVVATIVSIQDLQCFTARVPEKLTEEIYNISCSFNPGFILKALGDSLAMAALAYQGILKTVSEKVVNNENISIDDKSTFVDSLNVAQQQAIRLSESKEVSLIWGPPGTGKTHTLAQTIYRAFLRDEKVLVLSTSNIAIDQVLIYLDKFIYPDEEKDIYRIGSTENTVCNKYIHHDTSLSACSILFSTLAAAVLKFDVLKNIKFDMVVVDEASMVSLPYALIAAALARRNIVFSGDFRQLPPISSVESSVMSDSIFDYLDIPNAIDRGVSVPYMALLDTQYRMDKGISDVVSMLFYNGLLRCGKTTQDMVLESPCFHFVDVNDSSGYRGSYYSVGYKSYYNPVSIGIITWVSKWLKKRNTLLYITPFRAQQNIASYSFIDQELTLSATSLTVHRAQGIEADVVIFDLTTYARTSKPEYSKMLTSRHTRNLVNVAISRAIHKLIVVGSVKSLIELSELDPFWADFFETVSDRFSIIKAGNVLTSLDVFKPKVDDEKSILAVDTTNSFDYLETIEKSNAERREYIASVELPVSGGVTTKTVKPGELPDFLVWGESVVLRSAGRYYATKQKMVAEVLKRIAVGHLGDVSDPSTRTSHVLICSNCSGNKDPRIQLRSATPAYVLTPM